MATSWQRLVAALMLAFACLGAFGRAAWADDGPDKPVTIPPPVESQLDPAVRSVPTILKPQGAQGAEANSPGGSALVESQGRSDGSAQSGGLGSKLWAWAKDHGKGLLMGIGVGVVIAGAILLAPLVLPALAMSTAMLLAGTAVTSAGLYGLMTGAERFSVTECVVLTGISVLSVAAGAGMAAVGVGARALKWGKVALNALEGGVANAASYLITDPHPTALGALQRFGVGMVFTTGFIAAGNAVSKAYAAYKAARGLSHLPLGGLAGHVEGGAARGDVVVGGTSRAAVLERAQMLTDIHEAQAAGPASKMELAATQQQLQDIEAYRASHGYEFDLFHAGPLRATTARNFAGSKYSTHLFTEDTVLYRAGDADNPYGQWYTFEPPVSRAEARIDTAVRDIWIDSESGAFLAQSPLEKVYAIQIPAGQVGYVGPVANQGEVYLAGTSKVQIYLEKPWLKGAKVINSWRLKR